MKSPTKSCFLAPWPTFLVKECIYILLPSITRLVNCSLSEGVVPDEFKKAIVTPLIKKSSLPPNDLKNYRPFSGLGFISKFVERVVVSHVNVHISLNELENVRQSAYKLGHSTESALLSIKNNVHLAFAKGEATAVILLDQSAVFDTIDHDTLLDSPGLVLVGLSAIGSSLISQTVFSALRLGQFYLMPKVIVWCASRLCPEANPFFTIYYSPE